MENKINDMIERMTAWIVDHMDQQELTALAHEVVAKNISDLGDAEIKAQHDEMFSE